MILDRTLPPPVVPVGNFPIQKSETFYLSNGLRVHVVNAGKVPVLNLHLAFYAGKWFEAEKGQSFLTAKMLFEGTAAYTSSQISAYFDQLGAFWEVQNGYDLLTIDVYCLSRHLEAVSQMITQVATRASFPQKELERVKDIVKQQLKINFEKNSYLASLKARELLFGQNHPYGYHLSPELVDDFDRQKLLDFYSQRIAAQPFEIMLSGEVNTDQHIAILEQTFGKIQIETSLPEEPTREGMPDSKKETFYSFREDAVQTSIKMVRHIAPLNHPDRIPLEVANEILGGYFGSRLMKNIREEKGYTYGIYASLVNAHQGSYQLIGADVKKANRQDTIEEIKKEIRLLQQVPVEAEELETVKSYMAGSHLRAIHTPLSLAEYHKTIFFHQLPTDYFDNYITQIKQVTAGQVQEMANKYFDDDYVEVLVG